MADNVDYTPGVGKTIAADDVGGVLYQRVKIVHGADGANDGDASTATPLPVTEGDGKNVALGATTDASAPADNSNVGLIALFKRLLARLTTLIATVATEATLALVKAKTDNLDVALSTRLKPADTLAGVTTVAAVTAITNALPAGANVIGGVTGDVDHDAVNTLKNIQMAGHASPVDVPPAAVSASGDRVRAWMDRYGTNIVRRRKIRESYTAVFRLAEAAARLDQTFTHVANTNKQWMTIHHAATATKEVWVHKVVVYILGWSVASQAILELRQLSVTTPPATGNPAITPTPRRQGGGAAEATCLYLPTTQGSELGVNSPVSSLIIDEGIMAAASAVNPLPSQEIVLFDSSRDDDEMLPPVLPLGAYAGLAVMLRTVGIPAVRMAGYINFSEEIP